MRLYLLKPKDQNDPLWDKHDTSQSVIVRARNEQDARVMANSVAGDEAKELFGGVPDVWLSDRVNCELLTWAGEPGLICHNFRAG